MIFKTTTLLAVAFVSAASFFSEKASAQSTPSGQPLEYGLVCSAVQYSVELENGQKNSIYHGLRPLPAPINTAATAAPNSIVDPYDEPADIRALLKMPRPNGITGIVYDLYAAGYEDEIKTTLTFETVRFFPSHTKLIATVFAKKQGEWKVINSVTLPNIDVIAIPNTWNLISIEVPNPRLSQLYIDHAGAAESYEGLDARELMEVDVKCNRCKREVKADGTAVCREE